MLSKDVVLFVVDMNELEHGRYLTISLDFTVNYGPGVHGPIETPRVGDTVRIHWDGDDVVYYAKVTDALNDLDLVVEVLWDTCAPVLNKEWSARPVANSVPSFEVKNYSDVGTLAGAGTDAP